MSSDARSSDRGGPVRVVFVGSGGFGRATLRALSDARGWRTPLALVGVVTAPPRAAGRAGTVTPTPIDRLARELAVPSVLTPERLRAPDAVGSVRDLGPDLLVVADYGQIVPRSLLEVPSGALNVHPSRLPRHRGASPIPATILAGDRDTAVTLIAMDEGIDTGPIVAVSEPVGVTDDATTPALEALLEVVAADLVRDALPRWLAREIAPVPQPADGETTTRPLRRDDGRLDPDRAAFVLERQVRAYQPWPGTFLETTDGDRLAVLRAAVAESLPEDMPGRLVGDGPGLALTTIDGRLRLLEVRPAGGRPMPADAYRRGRPRVVGAVVPRAGATMADR